jgi:hypothetical protein
MPFIKAQIGVMATGWRNLDLNKKGRRNVSLRRPFSPDNPPFPDGCWLLLLQCEGLITACLSKG